MPFLKQSTAYTFRLGPFVDSTDGNTQENALTIAAASVLLSKAGGALAAKTDATALTGTGANAHYTCPLDATDTGTLGTLRVWCHITGALAVYKDFIVLPALVYDSLVAGSDALQVDTIQVGGTTQTARDLGAGLVGTIAAGTHNPQSGDTFAKFSGITSLAQWLGLIAGKQVGNATARTELRATGAGAGTYDETTDSTEAIRDTAPLGTAMRGTDNAALASVCTETRLAELDAANLPTDIAARATPAQVNAEVLDVLNVDTFAEPGQESPAATNTLAKKIGYLFKFLRNKVTQDATTLSVYADDGITVDQKSTVSDDATTYTRGEIVGGP